MKWTVLVLVSVVSTVAHAQDVPPETPEANVEAGPEANASATQETTVPEPPRTPLLSPSDQLARELYARGNRSYAEGDYSAAMEAFQDAYRVSNRPVFLYNMANAQERTGNWDAAVMSLQSYLLTNPDDADVLRLRIENLNTRIADRRREREAAQARAEEEAQEIARLQAERDNRPDYGAITLIVGGTALVGAGLGSGLAASRRRSDAEGFCTRTAAGDARCSIGAQGDIDRAQRFAIAADVLVATGIIFAGIGVYVLIKNRRARRERQAEAAATFDVAVAPTGAAVTVRGRF